MSIERIIPGTLEWDAFYANSIFRYQFALKQLKENNRRNVLDAASGVGFGGQYLAKNGIEKVTCIDRSKEALAIGREQFTHPSLQLLEDDCYTLANARSKGLYDAIVSCETLEHLPEPDRFLQSCHAALEPGGLLVVSTPNFDFSPNRSEVWDFHEKEYKQQELVDILTKHGFRDVRIYGQSFTDIGWLREDIRAELNKINSNPFSRAGRYLQKTFRSLKPAATLPERLVDFMVSTPDQFEGNQPFVLFAVAYKA